MFNKGKIVTTNSTINNEEEIEYFFTYKSEFQRNLCRQDPRVKKREPVILKVLYYETVTIDRETVSKNYIWDEAVS